MKKIIIEDSKILTPLGDLKETVKALYEKKSAVVSGKFYGCDASIAKMFKNLSPKDIVGYYADDKLLQYNNTKTLFIYSVAKGDINKIINPNYSGYSPILSEQSKQVAADLGLGDCRISVSANACAAGATAIDTARLFLQSGECERVIIFGFEQISEFTVKGFHSLRAISSTGAKPFDANRNGMSLGEGSGMLILSIPRLPAASTPLQKGNLFRSYIIDSCFPPFCERTLQMGNCFIIGSGASNDANHRTAPSRDGSGLEAAIERALNSAKISAENISAIKCHGTATPYNDAMEAKAIAKIFDITPPMVSTKGALGHLSGAGSMIETIISAEFLRHGKLPATLGFNEFEGEEKISISNENQKFAGNKILCLSCGFGGMNAAVILERA